MPISGARLLVKMRVADIISAFDKSLRLACANIHFTPAMTLRALHSKPLSTENDPADLLPTTVSPEKVDHEPIETLQRQIECKEKVFRGSMNSVRLNVDTSIDDLRILMDQKRPEAKVYPIVFCDLWLRLKTVQLLEPAKLVTFLHRHRTEDQAWKAYAEMIVHNQSSLANPRQSRLFHCHIIKGSDPFDRRNQFYVGLMIFSYENQLKFKLNGHHCQRGDILIKKTTFLSSNQFVRRGIYDSLFRWYAARSIDAGFTGIGFVYINGQWRFDTIVHDHQLFLPFEYRILDMFLLTHWLTTEHVPRHVQEMENLVKALIEREFHSVKNHLVQQGSLIKSSNLWNEMTSTDNHDVSVAIDQWNQITETEIELVFTAITRKKNSSAPTDTANACID